VKTTKKKICRQSGFILDEEHHSTGADQSNRRLWREYLFAIMVVYQKETVPISDGDQTKQQKIQKYKCIKRRMIADVVVA